MNVGAAVQDHSNFYVASTSTESFRGSDKSFAAVQATAVDIFLCEIQVSADEGNCVTRTTRVCEAELLKVVVGKFHCTNQ